MVDAHAHRGGMPKIAKFILKRAAVPRSLRKTARADGIRVMLLPGKKPLRAVAHKHGIAVGRKLGARRRVLEIILIVYLVKISALHKGAAARKERNIFLPEGALVFIHRLIVDAVARRVGGNDVKPLPLRGHLLHVHLHAVDGLFGRTPPIEIRLLPLEVEVRIPEGKGRVDKLKALKRVFGA